MINVINNDAASLHDQLVSQYKQPFKTTSVLHHLHDLQILN